MAIWTDSESIDITGAVGFLIMRTSERGHETYSLSDRPAHGNSGGGPQLTGWCGSWNNVSTDADGLARVARTAKNGRVRLARVPATAALLEELGYPKLSEDVVDPDVERLDKLLDAAGLQLARNDGKCPTDADMIRAIGIFASQS